MRYFFPVTDTSVDRVPDSIYLSALKTAPDRAAILAAAATLDGRVTTAATAARSAAQLDPAELARLRSELAEAEARARDLRTALSAMEARAQALTKAASAVELAGSALAPAYAAAASYFAVEDKLLARERELTAVLDAHRLAALANGEDWPEPEPLTPTGAPESFANLTPAQQTARLLHGVSSQLKALQLGYPLRDMEAGSCGEARALIAESFGRPVPQCPLWSSIFGEVHLETAEATAGGYVATGAVSRRP